MNLSYMLEETRKLMSEETDKKNKKKLEKKYNKLETCIKLDDMLKEDNKGVGKYLTCSGHGYNCTGQVENIIIKINKNKIETIVTLKLTEKIFRGHEYTGSGYHITSHTKWGLVVSNPVTTKIVKNPEYVYEYVNGEYIIDYYYDPSM